MKRRSFLVILILLLSLNVFVSGVMADSIKVIVNGLEINFTDIKPFISEKGRTMVPLRFVSQALGAEVEWNGVNQSIVIEYNDKKIEMVVGDIKGKINGSEVLFELGPQLVGDRTVVPLRFISETLGAQVEWDGKSNTITITTLVDSDNKEKPVEVVQEEIKEFQGQPFKPSDLPTKAGYDIYRPNELNGGKIQYVTVQELPIKLGNYIIYDLEITDKSIKVKQYSEYKDPISFRMIENNMLCRSRDFLDPMETNTFTYEYPIIYGGDNWETNKYIPNKTDITKVSNFALHTIDEELEFILLAIENPLYEGG